MCYWLGIIMFVCMYLMFVLYLLNFLIILKCKCVDWVFLSYYYKYIINLGLNWGLYFEIYKILNFWWWWLLGVLFVWGGNVWYVYVVNLSSIVISFYVM